MSKNLNDTELRLMCIVVYNHINDLRILLSTLDSLSLVAMQVQEEINEFTAILDKLKNEK